MSKVRIGAAVAFVAVFICAAVPTNLRALDLEAPIIGSWTLATTIRLVGQPREFFITSELDKTDERTPSIAIICSLAKYRFEFTDLYEQKGHRSIELKIDGGPTLTLRSAVQTSFGYGLQLISSLSPSDITSLREARSTIAVAVPGATSKAVTFVAKGTRSAMGALDQACEQSAPPD